jgi:hypothetical protein
MVHKGENPIGQRALRATPRLVAIVAITVARVAMGVTLGSYYSEIESSRSLV